MTLNEILSLIISIGLVIYLMYALLFPEKL